MLIWPLEQDEVLLWQGRPAPRCYLFRCWRGQLVTLIVLLFVGAFFRQVRQQDVTSMTLIFFLALFLLALVYGPLRLIYLRWHWETLFYAVSDRRLLVRSGSNKQMVSYPWLLLDAIVVHPYTDQLADIELTFADSRRVVLACLEEPRTCLRALPLPAANSPEKNTSV
ncbi:hypothetical protein [Pelovirga terrestris]|uniref:DUF304 domain-containing protein n=1 Tax=Pelovirga terrestris TaxID=2771352 RepID=A0A8J6QVV3_9BACT|nr:hypothetical protein [Pelovirga terrestris]MBD1399078.1 hypothetical protein [Pelovirga terrestris]